MVSTPSILAALTVAAVAFYWRFYCPSCSSTFRAHNFSAGPSRMFENVMQKAQKEFLSFQGKGMGFLEMSHRDATGEVQQTMKETEKKLRQTLDIPDNYHVLFMQGGAHALFAANPLNLLRGKRNNGAGSDAGGADRPKKMVYVITGFWSERAAKEAEKFGDVLRLDGIRQDEKNGRVSLADPANDWKFSSTGISSPKDVAFVHFCACETIHGREFFEEPTLNQKEWGNDIPIVADFTSTLLSRPVNVSRYGVIYASGGKNLGPAGFVVAIVRKDLVGEGFALPQTPSILNFHSIADTKPIPSIYNTPPTFQIYMHSLVLGEIEARGGLSAIEKGAIARAARVYSAFDASNGFYTSSVEKKDRSRMAIPFRIRNGERKELEDLFLAEANKRGLLQLHGHPIFGGLRITIYNGVPDSSIDVLIQFLKEFASSHGSK